MQIGFHVVENHINVFIILGFYNIQKSDDILVAVKFLQEHNLSEGTLSIRFIMKRIKHFLKCHNLFIFLVHSFPDNTVGTFTYFLDNFKLAEDMGFDVIGHFFNGSRINDFNCLLNY